MLLWLFKFTQCGMNKRIKEKFFGNSAKPQTPPGKMRSLNSRYHAVVGRCSGPSHQWNCPSGSRIWFNAATNSSIGRCVLEVVMCTNTQVANWEVTWLLAVLQGCGPLASVWEGLKCGLNQLRDSYALITLCWYCHYVAFISSRLLFHWQNGAASRVQVEPVSTADAGLIKDEQLVCQRWDGLSTTTQAPQETARLVNSHSAQLILVTQSIVTFV